MPKVTVMIPTYNYARFLGEAIQSVLDQTFTDFELIIVDDGSTDNTREVVESFQDARIKYIYQDHRGVSAAENAALRVACGEYITGVAADDIYLPQNLEIKVKLLDSRPDVGLVCSDVYGFDDNTGAITGKFWHENGPYPGFDPVKAVQQPLKDLLHYGCVFLVQASLIRRKIFDVVGYFDESLSTSEDWDLLIRIVQRFRIEIIDVPLVKCRLHSNNLTKNIDKMYWGEVAAFNKVRRCGSLSRGDFKHLKERMLPKHISYGREALLGGKEAVARTAFISAIKLAPWNFGLYNYLFFSLLGARKYLAWKNRRKKLFRHPREHQS